MGHGRRRLTALTVCFFLSGFAALVYQVVWERVLKLSVGADVVADTLVVAAFMAGLGLGSLLGGAVADRFGARRALLAFVACELAIGAIGFVSIQLYRYRFYEATVGWDVAPIWIFASLFVALLPPTALMGMSLPLLARTTVETVDEAAATIGRLYMVNALGAAVGAWSAGFLLIGSFGMAGAVRFGVLANGVAALIAALVAAGDRGASPAAGAVPAGQPCASSAGEPGGTPSAPSSSLAFWCLAYGISGFIGLTLEMIWFRHVAVIVKSNSYTFAHVVGLYIMFLAIGAHLGVRRTRHVRSPGQLFLWLQWFVTIYAAGSLFLLYVWMRGGSSFADYVAGTSRIDLKVLRFVFHEGGVGGAYLAAVANLYVVFPAILLGAPVLAMGYAFPLIQKRIHDDAGDLGRRVGLLSAANILGSTLGALMTGLVFLDAVQTTGTLRIILALGCVGLLGSLALERPAGSGRARVVAALVLSGWMAAVFPASGPYFTSLHGFRQSEFPIADEASCVCIAARRGSENSWIFLSNGLGQSRLPPMPNHLSLGLIGVLHHPRPRKVLVIGLGSGGTAYCASARAETESVTCVEICGANVTILRQAAGRADFQLARAILETPKLELKVGDGRKALALAPGQFDVIEIDAILPSTAGSGNLYSREFFELCRSKLAPGGLFVTWRPTPRVERTLKQIFPYRFEAGGSTTCSVEPLRPTSAAILARYRDSSVQSHLTRAGIAPPLFEAQLEREPIKILDDVEIPGDPADVNRDLWPRDEYFLNN